MAAPRPFETHLLSRATFGWTPDAENELLRVGWQAWLDAQLDPTSIADAAMDARLADFQTLGNSNSQNRTLAETVEDGEERIAYELAHSTLLRAVYSRRQLHETMVDFWANHLNVYIQDHWLGFCRPLDHHSVARTHALGRFADLLLASAHSPAMLIYLDNYQSDANSAEGPNENWARELLELHTMGILDGVQPFTEADMVGVALVLSGFSISEGLEFQYRSAHHWTGPVSLFGGEWQTSGNGGTAGYDDGLSLLNHLARRPETARHLATKLCRRFVADEPPTSLVDSAAGVYLANDTAIGPVLRHIFHSAEFAATAGQKLRRGFDATAATLRALDAEIDADPMSEGARYLHSSWGVMSRMGHRLFGHHPPDGYPEEAAAWISADGVLRRWAFPGAMTGTWFPNVSVDLAALARPAGDTVGEWITVMAQRLLGVVQGHDPHGFTDVPAWVDPAVRWIKAEGHATGYPNNTYRPDNPITRAETTRMLWNIAGAPAGHPDHGFTDVPAWVDPAVRWIKAEGHATGYPNNTYRPDNPITRAETTRMLWNIHDARSDVLTSEERAAALTLFTDVPRTENQSVPEWLIDWKAHDLATLLLSTPRFQHR